VTRWLAIVLLSVGLASPAWCDTASASRPGKPAAQDAASESGPAWNSLKPAHQAALAPLKPHWSGIDANRKAKWLVVAQRFPSLPLEERQRVQARMSEWASMSPAERGRARQNFQELRNLPHEDRQALWEAYRALPEEQRQQLAQRAKPVSKPAEPASVPSGKRPVAVNPAQVVAKPVSPTVVQAKPGATTTLVTKAPTPPAHHQPGLPKIAATPTFVNPTTLLPNRGPQGAATHSAAASASSEARP
jgi:Protein of unknown function (DUF3106)